MRSSPRPKAHPTLSGMPASSKVLCFTMPVPKISSHLPRNQTSTSKLGAVKGNVAGIHRTRRGSPDCASSAHRFLNKAKTSVLREAFKCRSAKFAASGCFRRCVSCQPSASAIFTSSWISMPEARSFSSIAAHSRSTIPLDPNSSKPHTLAPSI